MHEERIRSLKCWKNEVSTEPLPGGMTNANYRVDDGEAQYVVRVYTDRKDLGICRVNERVCQNAAHAAGVAPAVYYSEQGTLVSEYIAAPAMIEQDVREPDVIQRLAETLRQLHGSKYRVRDGMLNFCAIETTKQYAATARRVRATLPDDVDEALGQLSCLSAKLAPWVPTLCHNDLLAANILDDGCQLWLVDWEYAGIGHRLFDLANLSANSQLQPELELELVKAYAGSEALRILPDVGILKAVSLLRESLWASIQTVQAGPLHIDVDYQDLAARKYEQYRAVQADLQA